LPGLRATPFRVTSPTDPAYNCIAWAAGATTDWWWPLDDARKCFWPPGVPRTATFESSKDWKATSYGTVMLILKRPMPATGQ
jgi:hypothetical protein